MELGELRRVELRQQWTNKSSEFTPWLAEEVQMQALGAAIGLELELENTEVAVGPYSADILARDAGSDKYVLIENQLEKTNHDHLGKCVTYASVLDASAIIWIAKEFSEEHKKALDWLNDHTTEDVGFYGVIMELWQIDNSNPAIRFNVVSKPANIVRQTAVSTANEPLSDIRRLQYDFWLQFREKLQERPEIPSVQSARPQYWFDVSLGRTGIHLSNTANTYDNLIGIRVYINNSIANAAMQKLLEQREEIEEEIGQELQWDPNPENRDKTIVLTRSGDLREKSKWDEYLDWLVEQTVLFRKVFAPRIRDLNLDSTT